MTNGRDDDALQAGLRRMLGDPRVATATLPDLIEPVLPDPWWLVAHRPRLTADVVVLRRAGSDTWAVLSVPTPVRGRPSTWAMRPPVSVPYDELPGDKRAVALAEALPAWVGSVTEIVGPWLPTPEDFRREDLFEEERRISTGHLVLVDVLLEVVPEADRLSLEKMLGRVGVAPPLADLVSRRFRGNDQ